MPAKRGSKNSKWMYHSELVKLTQERPTEIEIVGTPQPSKVDGKPPFCEIRIDGVSKFLSIENLGIGQTLEEYAGQMVGVRAGGREDEAYLMIVGSDTTQPAPQSRPEIKPEPEPEPAKTPKPVAKSAQQLTGVKQVKMRIAQRMNLMLLCERKIFMVQAKRREMEIPEWTSDEASTRVTTLFISADKDKLWQNLPYQDFPELWEM
jgi:hypothetical protein